MYELSMHDGVAHVGEAQRDSRSRVCDKQAMAESVEKDVTLLTDGLEID